MPLAQIRTLRVQSSGRKAKVNGPEALVYDRMLHDSRVLGVLGSMSENR